MRDHRTGGPVSFLWRFAISREISPRTLRPDSNGPCCSIRQSRIGTGPRCCTGRSEARPLRGELHRRRSGRRRGMYRRSLSHRRSHVRGDPTASHLLSRRDPARGTEDGRVAGVASQARFLLQGAARGPCRSGSGHREDRIRPRIGVGQRDRCLAVPSRPPSGGVAARITHSRIEPQLAGFVAQLAGSSRPRRCERQRVAQSRSVSVARRTVNRGLRQPSQSATQCAW